MKYFKPTILVVAFFLLLASFFLFPNTADAGIIHRTSNNLGLVGYWTFNGEDLVDNVRDRSGQDNNGVISGQTATSTTLGKIGQALDFDGSDDGINAGSNSSIDELIPFTVAFWMNSDAGASQFDSLVSKDGASIGWHISHQTFGSAFKIQLFSAFDTTGGDWGTPDNSIPANVWKHVVVTYDKSSDANDPLMYIDGVSQTVTEITTPSGSSVADSAQDLLFGRRDGGGFYDGQLDDVRIYNRILSATEASKLYQSGKSRRNTVSKSGLVGHWKFDDGSGTDATDSSGNGNNGTLTNMDGSTDWIDGKRGGALDFDAASDDDYIALPSNLYGEVFSQSTFTATAWFKTPGFSGAGSKPIWITTGDSPNLWVVSIQEDGTVGSFFRDGASVSCSMNPTETYDDNLWHHMAIIRVGSTDTRMYVDGIQISSCSDNTGTMTFTASRISHHNNAWNGQIDDVRLYNRSLSADELNDLVNSVTSLKFQSTQDKLLTDGLVGYWSFNGKNLVDNVFDSSQNSNHGEINGQTSTSTVRGKVGQALDFDGVDDEVEIATADSLNFGTGSFTASAWVKAPDSSVKQTIAEKMWDNTSGTGGKGWSFSMNGVGRIEVRFSDTQGGATSGGYTTQADFDDDEWHHVVVVFERTTNDIYNVYVDGVDEALNSNDISPDGGDISNAFPFLIGVNYNKGGSRDNFMKGIIDEVRVYNRALSAAEVLRLYNMGL